MQSDPPGFLVFSRRSASAGPDTVAMLRYIGCIAIVAARPIP